MWPLTNPTIAIVKTGALNHHLSLLIMDPNISNRSLSIFVNSASDYLTNYESHGDGLICFALLNGLASRKHHIFAYTKYSAISQKEANLHVKVGGKHLVPFDSLAAWEHSWRADRWLQLLNCENQIDLVWRMHPYETGCPVLPRTLDKPLVVGPLFYSWPENEAMKAKPRFGIGIQKLVNPLAQAGWNRTLAAADLIICATSRQAENMQSRFPHTQILCLPVIVDPPIDVLFSKREFTQKSEPFNLLFIANLVANKNPLIFCEIVRLLRDRGLNIRASILGEGSLRSNIEKYCTEHNLQDIIHLVGKVSNSEVFSYLHQADLLVSTSLGEPYGRSIVEAMTIGTPCICHQSGGPAEIIENKLDGILVEELTAEAFAREIKPIYNSLQAWQYLAKNAQFKANNWKSNVVLDRLEEALLKLV
jgi:glycosyltransferase involved in cell wall biosynthesis